MARTINPTKGGRLKIPTALYSQYMREYERANEIIKNKAKSGAENLSFRSSDLQNFKTRKELLRYIRTTHNIVTGKFFDQQVTSFRQNLIKAVLENQGYTDLADVSITPFNIRAYKNQLDTKTLNVITLLSGITKEQVKTLEQNIGFNIIGYQYIQPDQDEKIDALIQYFNTPRESGGIFEGYNYFDNFIVPYYARWKW